MLVSWLGVGGVTEGAGAWYSTKKEVGELGQSLQWKSAISGLWPTNIGFQPPSLPGVNRMYLLSYSRPCAQSVAVGREMGRRDLMGYMFSFVSVRMILNTGGDVMHTSVIFILGLLLSGRSRFLNDCYQSW